MSAPLPPLPAVPGVDESAHQLGGASLFAQVGSDHAAIETLCRRITEQAGGPERDRLVDVLVATVSRHLSAEEQYLYPAVRAALPDGQRLADAEVAEDVRILRALADLDRAAPADFPGSLLEVLDLLREHINRIGAQLFPVLRDGLSPEESIRLGNRVTIAREAAPTRPHPATPVTPPWNKLVDPGLGVVDKVVDLVTRRPTRAEQL